MIIVYYAVLSLVFSFGSDVFADGGITSNISLNDSDISSPEVDTGGLFTTGVSFVRFLGLLTLGIGLGDVPSWFAVIFFLWQTMVTILSIGWFIASIWNG